MGLATSSGTASGSEALFDRLDTSTLIGSRRGAVGSLMTAHRLLAGKVNRPGGPTSRPLSHKKTTKDGFPGNGTDSELHA
jgi:hypothetical protein